MTKQADIKVRLSPDLKAQFDQNCRTNDTTMTAQLVRLIQSSLVVEPPNDSLPPIDDVSIAESDGNQNAVSEPNEKAATEIEILSAIESLATRMEELVDAHPQFWFKKWFDTRASLENQDLLRFSTQQAKHHSATEAALRDMRSHVTNVGRMAQYREPPFFQDYKIWTAFGVGVFALLLVLSLLPGDSTISRYLAEKMVGGANPVHAAKIIGGGNGWTGQLVVETTALMKEPTFASSFADCVAQAKLKPKPSNCRIKFPVLVAEK